MVARHEGFTYLAVLIGTALLTAGLGLAIQAWHTQAKREKEAELLHIGSQYQRAIMLYYESAPDGRPRYPRELKDLVRDDRHTSVRRYLRRLWPDPITGGEWGTMKGADGGIMGVFSISKQRPMRTITPGATYAEWKFAYRPVIAAPRPATRPKARPSISTP